MKRLCQLPLLCLVALPSALVSAAAPPAGPSSAKVARLIEQLGDDDFRVREAATEVLKKIGDPAYEALRKAARENDDLEIRRRAELIAQTIEGRWRIRRIAGRMEPRFKEAIEPYYSVAFSPDGRRALSGSHDSTMRLWALPK